MGCWVIYVYKHVTYVACLVYIMSIWKQYLKEKKKEARALDENVPPESTACSALITPELTQNLDRGRLDLKTQVESIDGDSCSVGSIPHIKYFENVLNAEAEEYLLHAIRTEGARPGVWTQLKTRRLQCWGGLPSPEFAQKCTDTAAHALPHWLAELCEAFTHTRLFPDPLLSPNHVLINEYQPAEGIMHHTDGPLYEDRVAIISLGSCAVMTFRPRVHTEDIKRSEGESPQDFQARPDETTVVLRPRSVLFFSADAYTHYMHGIEAVTGRMPPQGADEVRLLCVVLRL